MRSARELWREFFNQPYEVKEEYANSPSTYEGYGSRLGVDKGAILDWSDYFFLHYMPPSLRNQAKWPALPLSLRYELMHIIISLYYSLAIFGTPTVLRLHTYNSIILYLDIIIIKVNFTNFILDNINFFNGFHKLYCMYV